MPFKKTEDVAIFNRELKTPKTPKPKKIDNTIKIAEDFDETELSRPENYCGFYESPANEGQSDFTTDFNFGNSELFIQHNDSVTQWGATKDDALLSRLFQYELYKLCLQIKGINKSQFATLLLTIKHLFSTENNILLPGALNEFSEHFKSEHDLENIGFNNLSLSKTLWFSLHENTLLLTIIHQYKVNSATCMVSKTTWQFAPTTLAERKVVQLNCLEDARFINKADESAIMQQGSSDEQTEIPLMQALLGGSKAAQSFMGKETKKAKFNESDFFNEQMLVVMKTRKLPISTIAAQYEANARIYTASKALAKHSLAPENIRDNCEALKSVLVGFLTTYGETYGTHDTLEVQKSAISALKLLKQATENALSPLWALNALFAYLQTYYIYFCTEQLTGTEPHPILNEESSFYRLLKTILEDEKAGLLLDQESDNLQTLISFKITIRTTLYQALASLHNVFCELNKSYIETNSVGADLASRFKPDAKIQILHKKTPKLPKYRPDNLRNIKDFKPDATLDATLALTGYYAIPEDLQAVKIQLPAKAYAIFENPPCQRSHITQPNALQNIFQHDIASLCRAISNKHDDLYAALLKLINLSVPLIAKSPLEKYGELYQAKYKSAPSIFKTDFDRQFFAFKPTEQGLEIQVIHIYRPGLSEKTAKIDMIFSADWVIQYDTTNACLLMQCINEHSLFDTNHHSREFYPKTNKDDPNEKADFMKQLAGFNNKMTQSAFGKKKKRITRDSVIPSAIAPLLADPESHKVQLELNSADKAVNPIKAEALATLKNVLTAFLNPARKNETWQVTLDERTYVIAKSNIAYDIQATRTLSDNTKLGTTKDALTILINLKNYIEIYHAYCQNKTAIPLLYEAERPIIVLLNMLHDDQDLKTLFGITDENKIDFTAPKRETLLTLLDAVITSAQTIITHLQSIQKNKVSEAGEPLHGSFYQSLPADEDGLVNVNGTQIHQSWLLRPNGM